MRKRYLTLENSENDIIITFVLFSFELSLCPSVFPTSNITTPGESCSTVPWRGHKPGLFYQAELVSVSIAAFTEILLRQLQGLVRAIS